MPLSATTSTREECTARPQPVVPDIDPARQRSELVRWRQLHLLLSSHLGGLTGSWIHRLAQPLQKFKWLLWPKCYGLGDLYPNEDIEQAPHAPPGTWIAAGAEPTLLIPRWFPRGPMKVRLRLHSETAGRLVLVAQHGLEVHDARALATFTINPGVTEAELQLTLDRPALGMLLRPIETLDRFRIDELRLQPLSLWRRLRHIPADPSDLAERVHPRQPLPAMRRQDDEYPEIAFEGEPTLDWSIIIPTINELELVCQCVRSCRRYLPRDASIEFIVVDDGTRDAALRHALTAAGAEHGFQVHFTLQNLGFSAAVNLGMRHSKGRCLVLCNNDIQFFQPWLEPLRQCLTDHPQVGVVGARLLYPDGRIQHAGMTKLPDQLGWVHRYKDLSADHGPANRSEDVWSVTGALLALRREAVVQLGGLSNAYAMAYEDIDYCLHAWANGWGVRYEPEVAAYHLEGATRGTSPQERWTRPWLWVERDRLARSYFERKWRALHDVNRLQDFVDLCSCEEANALR